jgi:parallel beta-helix repeat protein
MHYLHGLRSHLSWHVWCIFSIISLGIYLAGQHSRFMGQEFWENGWLSIVREASGQEHSGYANRVPRQATDVQAVGAWNDLEAEESQGVSFLADDRVDPTGANPTSTTAGINSVIAAYEHTICKPGLYLINSNLFVTSNRHITLLPGCTITATTHATKPNWQDTGMIQLTDVSNITIEGSGILDGNKAVIGNQRLFGINLRGASNVKISGITIQNMPASTSTGGNGGDGIKLTKGMTESNNITVESVTLDGNVRNGISVTAASDVKISTVTVKNTTGTNPGAGIDIEHNSDADQLRNITISTSTFDNNNYHIQVNQRSVAADRSLSIVGNILHNHRGFSGIYINNAINTTVIGNMIRMNAGQGVSIIASDNNTIHANIFVGNYQPIERYGVLVAGNSTTDSRNNFIVGNTFYRLYHIGIFVDLIYNSGNVDGLTITNNRLYNVISPAETHKAPITFQVANGRTIKYVDFSQNIIRDTRTGGNEANIGIQAATLTDAELATWKIHNNIVAGPTTPLSVPEGW